MLTPADDYPLHQTPEPMALASGERNFYDRFFFNGYAADGSVFFAAALGVYPQLNIMDASFCLMVGGKQHNVRASKHMLGDRLNLVVGPVCIEIVEPLARVRVSVNDSENAITASLEATARHAAVEEPRFTRHNGPRLFMDYTRATQNVSWQGRSVSTAPRIRSPAGTARATGAGASGRSARMTRKAAFPKWFRNFTGYGRR